MEKLRIKSAPEYHEEILKALREEGIDPQVFVDSAKKDVPKMMKVRFAMEFRSMVFEAPMDLLQKGYLGPLIRQVSETAERQKQECLAFVRSAWQELKKKGVV